ncbi:MULTISPECIES: threonine/serine exporter family protein [Carnobacterium]|uniref:threonine/serine exporter family protein n=1 Tax=Carnobacterium TaxID=2747 RepID=UPI0007F51264|nr:MULTISPECIES: threonine/serine exporter family protein [Carnobacterium]MCO6019174.1 threonine/serine exporter family protein [Carnobacterium divergens]MDT1940158.1 threonine/serine exporter family protein [Carnobacterium divergens]MDT1942596.1 threonine/serine exporter family protein [Carnobacterium divergens]MDT1948402.1 threonine/serine exporter family protein [Carnobacterium divergens]MDT1950882.1 threonine/serine exporter family protein [Carnobacterium divergens]
MFDLAIQLTFSFLTTAAFAIITNVPKRSLVSCGLTGMLGWIVYWGTGQFGVSNVLATFLGAFTVAIFSHFFSRIKKMPVTIFNIPGIVPLVPGALAYQAVRNLVLGDYVVAVSISVKVLLVAGAIASGLVISEVFNHNIRNFREKKEHF